MAKSILVAWELGGGLGHLVRALPVVRRFLERGYRVALASRDLSRVSRIFSGLGVTCYQAPVKTARAENRVETPRSFAHILHNSGYGDDDELRGMAEAWRNLFEIVRPDLVLCDHSPTALLAASGMEFRTATIGTGFCCPPDSNPFPDFRPWMPEAKEQLRRDEGVILARVNRLLESWGEPGIDRLAWLYSRVDECFLATFRELDHYPMRSGGRYWGAWPNCGGEAPVWPQRGRGKRVFAYLKQFPALPALLNLLNRFDLSALVYCDRLTPALRKQCESPSVHFVSRPLDLAQVGRECDFAILNAGHGATASMLLAGIPILQVPLNLEQTHTSLATARLGAGLGLEITKPAQFADGLAKMVACDQFTEGARRFAARYSAFDPERQLDLLAVRVDDLLSRAQRGGDARAWAPAKDAASRTIVVGIGTGRCGTKSLAALLSQQPSTAVGHELRPLLPWDQSAAPQSMRARFEALLAWYPQVARVGDVAHFYLPYVEQILDVFESARVVCLKRDRTETLESYLRWTVETRKGRPVNHWSADREGFDADVWDACFPKYPTRDLAEAIGRYWDDYYDRAADLVQRFPDRVQIFPTERVLNDPDGMAALLDWIGIPQRQQNRVAVHANRTGAVGVSWRTLNCP